MVSEEKRPILHIAYSTFEKILEVFTALVIIFNFIVLAKDYNYIPNTIPTHFDAAGNPNSWGSKGTLFILLIVMIILYSLLTLLSRFPHIYNYTTEITEDNAEFQYHNARKLMISLKAELVCTFTYIQLGSINVALGKSKGLGFAFLLVCILIIFITVGFYIYRSIKSNKN